MKIMSIDMKFCGKALRCNCNKDSNFVYKYHIQNKNHVSTVITNTQKMKKTNRLLTVKNYEP